MNTQGHLEAILVCPVALHFHTMAIIQNRPRSLFGAKFAYIRDRERPGLIPRGRDPTYFIILTEGVCKSQSSITKEGSWQ